MRNTITWCSRLRTGLRLQAPEEQNVEAYFSKSEQALQALSRLKGLQDWELSAAYYAMYLAGMALLAKAGVSSQNHRCTLAFLSLLLSKEDLYLLERGKENREIGQYFVERTVLAKEAENLIRESPRFCAKCRGLAEQLDEKSIAMLRAKVAAFLPPT